MAELADEWPSLAPIRTSSSSRSCHYSYFYEPHVTYTHTPINSSCSPPLSRTPSFQSPPSCHVSFLHPSNQKTHSFLSKCFPPMPFHSTSHAFPKQSISASPARDMRRGAPAGASMSRSPASFPCQTGCRPALTICGIAANTAHPGPVKPGHSGALKSSACKGHLATNMNAFTMIPANVVGKKKPPDYLSDEPTSPEVTCIGGVRRSKHSKSTWDALLNSSEKLCKKKKAPIKQIEYHSTRGNLDHYLQLAQAPRPLYSVGSSGTTSKWRKMVSLFKDIKGMHSPYVQRKLRQENLVIELSQLGAACGAGDRFLVDPTHESAMQNAGNGILYICQAGEEEEDTGISQEEAGNDVIHADTPLAHPNCLHLMRNMSGRSKVFHNQDDSSGSGSKEQPDPLPASKVICPSPDQTNGDKKQAPSYWKSKKLSFSPSRAFVRGQTDSKRGTLH